MTERAAREEYLIQTLLSAEPYIRHASEEVGYGFYRPANPHDFTPDSDSEPAEIEAHKAACEAYDKGEYVDQHPSGWLTPTIHVTTAPWGLGSYVIHDDAAVELLKIIDALRKERA